MLTGRRPPSVVFKDGEPGVVNGNMDQSILDAVTEQLSNSNSSIDSEGVEVKPKLREWEKHKAPWLEEMKLNQAKRTSTSPGPEQSKMKLTPTDKAETDEAVSPKISEGSPVEMSKSTSSINSRLKTPPNELEKPPNPVAVRTKPVHPVPMSVRPQTIHSINDTQAQIPAHPTHTKVTSPTPQVNRTPSPAQKPLPLDRLNEASGDSHKELISYKQYSELLERIDRLEMLLEKQNKLHCSAIEDLRGKLQVETDMRLMLQTELDRVAQCVMQV